jgi:hypothetical protein
MKLKEFNPTMIDTGRNLGFVLAPLAPLLQCVFAQCQMIAPNSSLQDWHALLLDKEPWFDSSTVSSLAAVHGSDS